MRRALTLLTLILILATSAVGQNTDIDSLSGLQFNFGNPGARSLAMGGAFLGLADDASAAEANPAGLTILRKPEITIEGRHYVEQQVLTTSGTYPDLERTGFAHNSQSVQVGFASAVFPIRNRFTVGAYYHEPLRNSGGGFVVPIYSQFTGQLEKPVPNFFLPKGGPAPVTRQECERIKREANDFFACLEYDVRGFFSALDVQLRTWGVAGAWQVHPRFSVGATARYQTFKEAAFASRFTEDYSGIEAVFVQVTGTSTEAGGIDQSQESDLSFGVGFKWSVTDKIGLGGVYKLGPKFSAPIFAADASTNSLFEKQADTTFHIPDIYGLGVSVRPIAALTVNVDAVHVTYSNLVDDLYAQSQIIRDLVDPYEARDVTELRIGAEYFFSTKVPLALRAGYWRDPAHSITYRGPLTAADMVVEAILFPKGEDANHVSVGGGIAWPRLQIDFAYDTAKRYKVGSVSVVARF